MTAELLLGDAREQAKHLVVAHHYTRGVPSGKSHYVGVDAAVVIWSIPANNNLAKFILRGPGTVWELSRLWAPDGHDRNLLTRAISGAVGWIRRLENPDALVSYADPNAGHLGGVYRAASWLYHGTSEEVRAWRSPDGTVVARRAFHSGKKFLIKAQIEALGYTQLKLPGKHRFVRPLSRRARKLLRQPDPHGNIETTA